MADKDPPVIEPDIVPVRRVPYASGSRFDVLTDDASDKSLSLLGALAVPVTNVKVSRVATPAVHPLASKDDANLSVTQPLVPRDAVTRPIDAILRNKVADIDLKQDVIGQRNIAKKVNRVQEYIEDNRMTLFVPVAGSVIEIARPDGFQPDLLPQAKGVYKAYSYLAESDNSITKENLSMPFGITMKNDADTGGQYSHSTRTASLRANTDNTPDSFLVGANTLVHENTHDQWFTNNMDHRFARPGTFGPRAPSEFIKTDIDQLVHKFANEAFAHTAEISAELLAKIDEMKRLSTDRSSGQAELDKISSIQGEIDAHLINYGDYKQKFQALTQGGEPYATARDKILKQEREALDTFVTNNKALPAEMRAKVFLDKLQNPSYVHVGYYVEAMNAALKVDPATYKRGGLTIPVEDIANLTRDASTEDKIGLSPLEEYVKANPDFNFKKFVDNLPWAQAQAQAQAMPGTPEERKALHVEVAKVSEQYDPDAKSRLARAEQATQAALQKSDLGGAVDAFKKYYGIGGNNFGDGVAGGGAGDGGIDIADAGLKQKVKSIIEPAPKDVIKSVEEKLARTAAKEILTEIIQPTAKSKPADHPYTLGNLLETSLMADASAKDIPARISELAQELPNKQGAAPAVIKSVTDGAMLSAREAWGKAVKAQYGLADKSKDAGSHDDWTTHLKKSTELLAGTDAYFAKEIAAGTIPQANLGTIVNNGKTSEQILSDLDKKGAALKAAEIADTAKVEDKTKKAPAPAAP